MTFDASDPRLTAYALGELDDTERAEIEALVAGSAEAHAFVEETRATAQLLTESLRNEPSPGLAPEQRRAIEQSLQAQSRTEAPPIPASDLTPIPSRHWLRPVRVVQLAVAA